ncbi:MAG: hypothetical protein IJX88_01155 [Clostridia bacterium]|nr:hypothetical protein [Clostridia bacterium]
MNYVKKMCILRQVKQGFSGDGKALSGLIKVEQYGKNLAVEVSIINFAPLASGEYYCLLSDGKGKTEMLALRGKSLFNILTDLDVSYGFCAIICYVKTEIVPIAYGINGNGSYDWKSILNATLPPIFPQNREETVATAAPEYAEEIEEAEFSESYDDEGLAKDNYYEEEKNEQVGVSEAVGNARTQSADTGEREKTGADTSKNENGASVLHAFTTDSDGYYQSVKAEIEELFNAHPRDDTLKGAFSCSDWVRVKGNKDKPEYLVGVVFDGNKAKYVCYALYAENKDAPPEEIKDVCAYVPASPFKGSGGYFVIFQSAATGECIKPRAV